MPRTLAFGYYLRLFIRARWLMVAAALTGTLFFQFVFPLTFPFASIYLTVAAVFLYNIAFWWQARRSGGADDTSRPVSQWRVDIDKNRRIALMQIVADLTALFFLLHFTGGIENPLVILFLLHVAAGAILLEARTAMGVAAFASSLILLLAVLEKTGILTHYHHVEVFGDFEPMDNWLFSLGLPLILTLIIGCLSALLIFIANEMSRKRDMIIALSEELAAKNSRLMELDHRRLRTMAVVSHDLKSPIAAVLAYLNTFKDGYLGELTEKQLDIVVKSIGRLERLNAFVRDVLAWQTIETGELRQDMVPEDLGSVLRQSVEDYRDAAKRNGVTLTSVIPDTLPLTKAAAPRMAQVFDNLISNAVKYTLNGGSVHVEAEVDDGTGTLVFRVRDTGVGMTNEEMKGLFQDFYRAPSVKTRFEGTGLGLSVARKIVEAHHGDISVDSQSGEGTCFSVRIPHLE